MVLGYPESDRVRAVQQEDLGPALKQSLPENEDAAVEAAMHNSRELRLLESQLQAANFAVREQKTQRLPQVDLVAQYALFARYNYQDFFAASQFRRNNAELGISVKLPLLIGTSVSGAMSQAEADMAKARIQANTTRSRISVDTRKTYGDMLRAENARSVARLDLDVARDELSILLAQLDEGRASEQQVNNARFTEQEKWIAYYQTSYAVERARLNLLKQTGKLSAALAR
jgi:outer membrane protein TolC